MNILFNMKHFANRALLTVLGPADLDDNNDPRVALKREHAQRHQSDETAVATVHALPTQPAGDTVAADPTPVPKAIA